MANVTLLTGYLFVDMTAKAAYNVPAGTPGLTNGQTDSTGRLLVKDDTGGLAWVPMDCVQFNEGVLPWQLS